MNPMLKQYTPALAEASREEMSAILTRKAEEIGPAGLADYVGFTIETIEDSKDRIKVAIADLKMLLQAAEGQEKIIKAEVRNLLEINGIDKIQGDRISSITLFDPAPKKKLVVLDKEAAIEAGFAKVSVDTTALKKAVEAGEVDEEVAVLEVEHQENSIKVNRRKQI